LLQRAILLLLRAKTTPAAASLSAESCRQNGVQVSDSDARQVHNPQRESRGAEEEQDYSDSPFDPPLYTWPREWIIGHRVICSRR
jgi:hypothetical protein